MDQNSDNQQKPSKRLRNPKNHKAFINKSRREKGQEYENYKGKLMQAKTFKSVICKCRLSCHLTVPQNEQKELFEEYWNLNSWNQRHRFY